MKTKKNRSLAERDLNDKRFREAIYSSEYGEFRIRTDGHAITALSWDPLRSGDDAQETTALTDRAFEQLLEYFRGQRCVFDLPLSAKGTAFQEAVWNALLEIPYGQTLSYGELAARIGRPRAARAVGGANNKNPIGILIPCHRVIGANGTLVGYAGGLELKRQLLSIEGICLKGNLVV